MINSLDRSDRSGRRNGSPDIYSWVSTRVKARLKAKSKKKRKASLDMLRQARLSVSSNLEELSVVQQWFQPLFFRLTKASPWLAEQFDQLNLALAEGFTNAVRHAHANLPSSTPIEIELWIQESSITRDCKTNCIEIRIFDRGAPFDPSSLSEPEPGSLREGGYGWFLLRRLADQVTYDCVAREGLSESVNSGGNCLRIVKTAGIL